MSKLVILLCVLACGKINAESYTFPKLNLSVTWKATQNTTLFSLIYNKTGSSLQNRWFAVGINSQEEMNGGNAFICFVNNSTSYWVGHYHLDGNTPKLFDDSNPNFGIKESSVTDLGSQFKCTFERENFLTKDRYLNSLQDLYILTALGTGELKYHGNNRAHTSQTVSLKQVPDTSTTSTAPSTTKTIASSTLKSTSKTDAGFSSDGWHYFPNLNMVVYWLLDEKKTKFIVEIDKPSNFEKGWFAIGLNTEPKMPGGNGVVCVINNNSDYSIHNYHFDGYTPKYFSEDYKNWGLSEASVVQEGTLLGCSFYRENVMNSSKYIKTNQEVYLLASFGAGSFGFHGINKALTEKMYSLVYKSTDDPELPFDWSDILNIEMLENVRKMVNQFIDQMITYLKALNLQNIFNNFTNNFNFSFK